jgi:hypothetical protein
MSLVNNQALINYINTYHSQLDKIYIDKFWSSINNKQWIYADDVLIEWIGFNISTGKAKYLKLIKENFKEIEDYKTYDYEEINKIFHSPLGANENNKEILEFKDKLKDVHNRTIHLILSPKCFKKSLMMIRTEKANSIRDYYVDIEEICLEFNKFLLETKNKELEESKMTLESKNKELEEQKHKVLNLKTFIAEDNELLFDEFIYIATNDFYSEQDVFKIGMSSRLNKRSKTFNTFFINGQKMQYIYIYRCHNSRILESLLFTCLKHYRYNIINELFNIPLDKLLPIVYSICNSYNLIINDTNVYFKKKDYPKLLNKDIKNPVGQIIPINFKETILNDKNNELLHKYLNNKNPSNIIIKNNSTFELDDELVKNNVYVCKEEETGYYYVNYCEKKIYFCSNCSMLKKDRRSLLQHTSMRNKCKSTKININSINDIELLIETQGIKLFNCNHCQIIFKTKDHYTRHISINCPKNV